jgi:hypothetical protein
VVTQEYESLITTIPVGLAQNLKLFPDVPVDTRRHRPVKVDVQHVMTTEKLSEPCGTIKVPCTTSFVPDGVLNDGEKPVNPTHFTNSLYSSAVIGVPLLNIPEAEIISVFRTGRSSTITKYVNERRLRRTTVASPITLSLLL